MLQEKLGTLEGDIIEDYALPIVSSASTYTGYIKEFRTVQRSTDYEAMQEHARRIGRLMGERGFYSIRFGKSKAEGGTVALARALAGAWGMCAFGVDVDRVEGRRVYMTGVCVDFCTGTVVRRGFVWSVTAPSGGFAKDAEQRARWEAMQIQSAGSRALRNAIFDALPDWFVQPGIDGAREASRQSLLKAGLSIDEARKAALEAFIKKGVSKEEVEAYVGAPMPQWADTDLVDLRSILVALREGETTIEATFAGIRADQPVDAPKASKRPTAADKARAALAGKEGGDDAGE